ncbi:dephospho-CoA kinase [Chlorobium phaeobacteroides]|uniref:Dephospho-CoA kinase n=1 Tax=Chlorobium phaeobacteroides (strain DSM 266 / SMG 266 / 2430) TaxID=290317 RepID=A1BF55_CHLPD|nr:dephospho-CoA kinase [Chlorobium phaeobacteroides]ABL65032.1 dephospho-CoA kinase [Chlorobium phaeobacteroides DSM 266]
MVVNPFLVGVTGGIGSGKSTLCRYLAELGCELFEADVVAKELQLDDSEVISGIKKLFGENVYGKDPEGNLFLDRRMIAGVVFSDREKLDALNRLVHPKVFNAFDRALERARSNGSRLLVKEAAILFESGSSTALDFVVVVASGMEERVARAVAKGLGSREEIFRRIGSQWPQEKLMEMADYVVCNNGSLEELRLKAVALYRYLLSLAERDS